MQPCPGPLISRLERNRQSTVSVGAPPGVPVTGLRCRPPPPLPPRQPTSRRPLAPEHPAGLSSAYCDEFVCTSSPAVEASVRQLARDLQRANGKWAGIYTQDVEYSVSEEEHSAWRGCLLLSSSASQASTACASKQARHACMHACMG